MAGIVISFYGTQIIIENIVSGGKQLAVGESLELSKILDPTINENGVFWVEISDLKKEDRVDISIMDPSEQTVISKSIDHSPFEDTFKISFSGNYKLLLTNNGEREIEAGGAIGYLLDRSIIISNTGGITILIGLLGLAGGAIFYIKSRQKQNIS